MEKIYDLVIIGAGPAGLSASIYASRYKLDHLLFGMEQGGQMEEIYEIENWPGDIRIAGHDLIERFSSHVQNYAVKTRQESVSNIKKDNEKNLFQIETAGGTHQARAVILAMGAKYRKMNIPGEKEFLGRGVSYCATCDAMFFKDKNVAVAGGGNSAAAVALELTDFAKNVYLIHRGEKMMAEPAWMDKIHSQEKIEILKNNSVLEIQGKDKVEKIILEKPFQDKTNLSVDGIFIEVGTEPGVELAKKLGIETDEQDYIKVEKDQTTNVLGIFAAGDITDGSNKFRQVLTASSEGAIAANSAYKMLKLK